MVHPTRSVNKYVGQDLEDLIIFQTLLLISNVRAHRPMYFDLVCVCVCCACIKQCTCTSYLSLDRPLTSAFASVAPQAMKDALEMAVLTTVSHPNIIQVGYSLGPRGRSFEKGRVESRNRGGWVRGA